MDGDELYYDDLVEGIAADELFALVDDAYAATQRQAADTIPRAVPPPQHVLPRQYNAHALGDKPDLKPVLQPPARLLRQPVSFGDTDAQTLDAGVLDDGGGPSLVDEQSARHRNGGNTAHILAHGQTGEQTRRFLQADVSSENYTGAIDASRGHGVNKAPDLEAHERPSMPDEALGNDYSEVINAGDLQQMDVEDMLDQIEQVCPRSIPAVFHDVANSRGS